MRPKHAARAIKDGVSGADYQAETPRPRTPISLPPASQTRAHVAHAPLRRLSEAALSACAPDELLDALADALRSARAVEDVRLCPPADEPAEPGAALVVPVAWAGGVHHVAVVGELAARVWTPDEVLIAGTLANQAALGLALLESEQRRIAQAERDTALTRAAHALNVSLELQEVLDTLAREADLAVGGEMAGVYLLDADGMGLATAGHNCPGEWFGYRIAPGEGVAGKVLASGRPVMTSRYREETQLLPARVMLGGVCAGVGVPR